MMIQRIEVLDYNFDDTFWVWLGKQKKLATSKQRHAGKVSVDIQISHGASCMQNKTAMSDTKFPKKSTENKRIKWYNDND